MIFLKFVFFFFYQSADIVYEQGVYTRLHIKKDLLLIHLFL